MRWLVTLLLSVLVAGGGAVLLFGDRVLPPLGLRTPEPPPSPVVADLALLQTDTIRKVEITRPGRPVQQFDRVGDQWRQNGGWDLRQEEVNELVATLAGLRTRFESLPLTGDGAEFGLTAEHKPLKVAVSTGERTRVLTIGQPPVPPGESPFGRPAFVRLDDAPEVIRIGPDVYAAIARPADAYLRRQLFADVKRARFNDPPTPGQSSQASDARKLLLGDEVKTIEIAGPDGKYTLSRAARTPAARRDPNARTGEPAVLPTELAEAWKLTAPTEDRVDPAKLKTVLTALPDLWVEQFVDPEPLAEFATEFFRASASAFVPTVVLQTTDRAALRDGLRAELTGFTREALEKQKKEIEAGRASVGVRTFTAERVVTVTRTDGRGVVLRIGAVSRATVRKEMVPPMGMFPASEREVRTEYRYARFDGNPRVFEVKGEKIADVFVKAEDLADPKLAHFTADEVSAVTVSVPRGFAAAAVPFAALGNQPLSTVTLTRVKGKPTAATEKGKKDRWFLGDRLAEASEVTALLESLTKMEAKSAADRQHAVAPPDFPVTITVTVEPKVAEGEDPLPKKAYTFQIAGRKAPEAPSPFGPPPAVKLAVKDTAWARLNWIDLPAPANPMAPPPGPAADELAIRPVATYRGKQLFDTADCTLDRVAVAADAGSLVTGTPAAVGPLSAVAPPTVPTGFEVVLPPAETKWALAAPVAMTADDAAAPKLAADLAELKAVEEVADNPTPAQLAEFGLTKPRFTITLGFRGTDAHTDTLALGTDVPNKQEVYARRNGTGGVFTIPKTVAESLSGGAAALLPKQPWTIAPDKITALAVKRGDKPDDAYTLTKYDAEAKKWALAGPFAVVADVPQAEALAAAVAGLKATRYEPLTVTPERRASYGLDRPAVRLTITAEDDKKPVTHVLLVGNKTAPDGTDRFAKLDGPNAPVFVVPDAVFAAADKSAVAYLDRKLLALDPSKLTKLQLSGTVADGNVTLLNDGKGWKPEGAAFPVDEPTVFTLATAATRLTVLKVVAYGTAANDAQYGFDKPARTLTLTVAGEPAPVVIRLGKEDPSGERYVRIDGKPAVGVVSGFVAATLTKGKLDVIDKGMFTFDPLQVTGVTRKKGAEEFELAPAGRGWEVAKPKKLKADKPLVEALAAEVGGLRAAKVAAFAPADLKPFGLDKPTAEVTFKTDGKDHSLKIGNPVPDDGGKPTEDRYAAVTGSQVVAVIPAALANRLLADPVKFSDRTLNPNRFVDADKVVVTRDGRTATFTKKDGVWKLTAPAEATAETGDLEDLIATTAQLRADELVANDAPADKLKELGFDPPAGRIVISNGDKELLNLLIGNKEKIGPRVHAKLDKAGLIGLLEPAISAKVTAEFRTRAVWPAADAAQADVLAFSGGGDFAFRKKDAATWEDLGAAGSPVDAGKVSDAVAALANLKAERYVADKDAKLALYGLDKPKRVIVLTLKGGDKRVLHLGGPVGGPMGKQVYAKVDDKDRTDVFVLSEADTTKLMGDRKAFAP